MKIAVTYEDGQVFQHFGHTAQFKLYEAQDGKILSSKVVDTNGSGHGALAGFLAAQGVDTLICGGIGGGAPPAGRCAHPRRRISPRTRSSHCPRNPSGANRARCSG